MKTLSKTEFNELLNLADTHCSQYSVLRKGQCLFWALQKLHPTLSKQIIKSIYDPFYKEDKNLTVFYKKIYPEYDTQK